VNDRLRDLGPDAADDAIGAHQAGGGDRLQQMLRGQRVDRRHAGDVDDRHFCALLHDRLQQVLHHHLRALAVERADQRQCEDAFPQLDDGCRQLGKLLLLAHDQGFTRLLVGLGRYQAKPVEQQGDRPVGLERSGHVGAAMALRGLDQRLLQRKHEHRGFARAEALGGTRRGDLAEQFAHTGKFRRIDVGRAGVQRFLQPRQKILALALQFAFPDAAALQGAICLELLQPQLLDLIAMGGKQRRCHLLGRFCHEGPPEG
jgi:hypothetical protein